MRAARLLDQRFGYLRRAAGDLRPWLPEYGLWLMPWLVPPVPPERKDPQN